MSHPREQPRDQQGSKQGAEFGHWGSQREMGEVLRTKDKVTGPSLGGGAGKEGGLRSSSGRSLHALSIVSPPLRVPPPPKAS